MKEYLKLEVRNEDEEISKEVLKKVELNRYLHIPGVQELLDLIPDGHNPDKMKIFYENTGLRLQVEKQDGQKGIVYYDKDGRYPSESASIWNKEFMEGLKDHPEWLEPQEDPDIIISYIEPIEVKDNLIRRLFFRDVKGALIFTIDVDFEKRRVSNLIVEKGRSRIAEIYYPEINYPSYDTLSTKIKFYLDEENVSFKKLIDYVEMNGFYSPYRPNLRVYVERVDEDE